MSSPQQGEPGGGIPGTHDTASSSPDVFTVEELVTLLRVSRKAVYASIARGEIPGVLRIGRAIRISRAVVLEWLAGQSRVSRKGRTR